MAKEGNYYINILSNALLSYRNRTGYTQVEMSTFLNDGKPAATGTYTNIELKSRKAGFIPFRKMARYFLKVRDTKTVKALLDYAALAPKDLLRILVADAWILVGDSLPRDKPVNISYTRDGVANVGSGHYNSINGLWYLDDFGTITGYKHQIIKIIAWQPLPAAFVAEGDKDE